MIGISFFDIEIKGSNNKTIKRKTFHSHVLDYKSIVFFSERKKKNKKKGYRKSIALPLAINTKYQEIFQDHYKS